MKNRYEWVSAPTQQTHFIFAIWSTVADDFCPSECVCMMGANLFMLWWYQWFLVMENKFTSLFLFFTRWRAIPKESVSKTKSWKWTFTKCFSFPNVIYYWFSISIVEHMVGFRLMSSTHTHDIRLLFTLVIRMIRLWSFKSSLQFTLYSHQLSIKVLWLS